jgi:hypothetical protein
LRSLVFFLLMAAVYLTLRWFLRQSYGTKVGAGLSALGLGLVLLTAIGRLPWVFGLVGGLLPLLFVMLSARQQRNDDQRHEQEPTGAQSVVETRFLRMTLDHDTGAMAGQVLAGRFAGVACDALSQEQLFELLNDFAGEDDESAALLRAYLDRSYGSDWQEAPRGDNNPEGLFGEMTRSDAYAILGLEEGASREQIIAAHGRLIQRLHPDRGGSTFLAAKINQARDLLLGA